MKTGSELIFIERERQETKKGWDSEHDDEHTEGELALVAVCYASPKHIYIQDKRATALIFKDPWPWDDKWDKRYTYASGNTLPKPSGYNQRERIRFLVKAGALIAAEIDRIQRLNK